MDFRVVIGLGAQAKVENELNYMGQPELFEQNGVSTAGTDTIHRLRTEGKTVILVSNANTITGLIALKDEPRPEAKQVVTDLQAMGIHAVMLTGDNDVTANAVAKDLGIIEVRANLNPEE
jgi:Cd2+/Zn2+-exporting ATPase